ncbi:methionine--tRNA ligase [Burkholderia ubonensis]|uniref:methionine--tRNA ligase n=1 Tax=Burkholderia ubonensis TaxID=101571 RepID=UPI000B28FC07|nr:methionine--tRNA ligase [Burkholderia ubonensis]
MQEEKKFYITTAIDYPNAAPHLGHAYEKVIADTYARWYGLLGSDVFFVTGTDENGQKLQQAAADAGIDTRAFVDRNEIFFRSLCEAASIGYSDFIRTSSARHHLIVQELWTKMRDAGDIYFDRYKGNYCLACESFYSASQAPGLQCPVHGRPLEEVEEDGYFFRLSKYHDAIEERLTDDDEIVYPHSVRQEMLSRLQRENLVDLSISRPNAGWGIEVPGDPGHVVYTWFDALISYYTCTRLSATGNAEPTGWWPASVHVIGKDISWFHVVIWPAMLMSAGLALPRQVYVHGMIVAEDGRRMSKSLGNGVDPFDCLERYSVDTFRYYLLRAIPSGLDGAFSFREMIRMHNSELANELGNLVMRTVRFALTHLGDRIAAHPAPKNLSLDLLNPMKQAMAQREHHRALAILWEGVRALNVYMQEQAPWRHKDKPEVTAPTVYALLANIHMILRLLYPFLPAASTRALTAIRFDGSAPALGTYPTLDFLIEDSPALFAKYED